MTELRESLHRYAVYLVVCLQLSAAAMRSVRRARHRRRFWHKVEAGWPW